MWEGSVDVSSDINREITTAIPVGELQSKLKPGAYILTAEAVNSADEMGAEGDAMVHRHRPRPDHALRQ